MKRIPLGAALLVLVLGVVASPASAKTFELGATEDGLTTASCPDNCFVVTRTTALQVRSGATTYPTTAPKSGRVVAFTLVLGKLSDKQVHFFNSTYGGTSRVQLTVLRGKPKRFYDVVAQTGIFKIQPFFGTTVTFPLKTSLAVAKGDVIALSVPTWAPVLAVNLPQENGWRASRADKCDELLTQTAQLEIGAEAQYKCLYQTARVTYSATLIQNPETPKAPAPAPGDKKTTK